MDSCSNQTNRLLVIDKLMCSAVSLAICFIPTKLIFHGRNGKDLLVSNGSNQNKARFTKIICSVAIPISIWRLDSQVTSLGPGLELKRVNLGKQLVEMSERSFLV